MTYSLDIREKSLKYVREGASNRQAAERFGVNEKTVRKWKKRANLSASQKGIHRQRKIDKNVLIQHVKQHPDATLLEYSRVFGVSINSIWTAFKSLNIRKKNDALSGTKVYKKG